MFRSKKLIIGVVLAVVLLAGSIGGVALANGGEDNDCPLARSGEFLDKVCENYGEGIDCAKLKAAFTEARSEMGPGGMPHYGEMDPEAMQEHLQNLYDEGEITKEQFDEMKARMESMPDDLRGFGFRGHGGFRGMGGMPGFGGPCAPAE